MHRTSEGHQRRWGATGTILLVVVGLALTFAPGGPGSPLVGSPRGGLLAAPHGRSSDGGNGLEATPSLWQMVAGDSVNLSAYLAPTAQGCLPIAVLITWQVDAGTAYLGYLNLTGGPHVRFTSFPYGSGQVDVTAEGLGIAYCGASWASFHAETTVQILLDPPLGLGGLTASPDPALPQAPVTLRVVPQGGAGPYSATFEFGDGSSQTVTSETPDGLTAFHSYPAGSYQPTVTVSDALGESVGEAATGTLYVSPTLTVAISGPPGEPEVGVPYRLSANLSGGQAPFSILWNDSLGGSAEGPVWDRLPTGPGADTVTVRVTDALGAVATASTSEIVAPPLNVSAATSRDAVDLGHPLPITLTISGGSGPFAVSVPALPSGSGLELAEIPSRSFSEAIVPSATGQLWVEVSVSDALGAAAGTIVPLAEVNPPPRINLTLARSTVEAGSPVSVVGLASGGSPPYAWSMAASQPLNGSGAMSGVPAGSPLFAWSGTVTTAGIAIVEATVTDASGVAVTANATLTVLPPLLLSVRSASANSTVNATDTIEARIAGGAPPYNLLFLATDGQSQSVNLSGPGPASWTWSPRLAGRATVTIEVADGLGRFEQENLTVPVGPAPGLPSDPPTTGTPSSPPSGGGSPPTTSPPPVATPAPSPAPSGGAPLAADFAGGLGATIGLGLMGLVGWVLLRGRFGAAARRPGPMGRELATVGRLLRDNEGIDRETLLLLAEGEAIDEATVDRAILRLKESGRISATADPDGQETYRSAPRRPPAGAPPPPERDRPDEGALP